MVEGVVDGRLDVEKSLRGSGRLEPLHLALSPPYDLMRGFNAIVFSEASIMRAGEAQLPESRAVGTQLVYDQQLRRETLFLEQLAHQPECRLYRADVERACPGPRVRGRRRAMDTPVPGDPDDHLASWATL